MKKKNKPGILKHLEELYLIELLVISLARKKNSCMKFTQSSRSSLCQKCLSLLQKEMKLSTGTNLKLSYNFQTTHSTRRKDWKRMRNRKINKKLLMTQMTSWLKLIKNYLVQKTRQMFQKNEWDFSEANLNRFLYQKNFYHRVSSVTKH